MRITRLVLLDYGKFHQEEFALSAGLNIATGANESGKTTLRHFIRSMFYGLERERGVKARRDAYTRLKPWEYGRFQGILEFEAEGGHYRLFRNFLTTEREVVLTELSTGRTIENPAEFLREQGLKSEAVYTNTFWVGNSCATEELLGAELKDYLANLAYSGGAGLNLKKSLDWLAMQKKVLLRRIPEQEINECMEILLTKEQLEEQVKRTDNRLKAVLTRQKELEDTIRRQKERSEQVAAECMLAEKEERQKVKGKWLLTLFCTLAAIFGTVAAAAMTGQLKAVFFGLGAVNLICGMAFGLPGIKKGGLAEKQKEALGKQLVSMASRLNESYQELTGLLPEIEQEKLRMEQTEEQLKRCEVAKERYEELKRQREAFFKEAEAVSFAAETLERLSAELYEEFGARFAEALSGYARAFTDHSYDALTADETLNLKAVTRERSLEISEVSFGTGEQFYLALRFAAADVFDPEKKNPIILDDSFASFDDQRLESAILALEKCGRQILVLSSTGREEMAAKRMGITYEAIF